MAVKTWQVPRIWEGGDAWIIGGGPSIIETFEIPENVVSEVRLRKKQLDAYSPYFAALHSKHVIGINVAYMLGNWLDICFFGDHKFFLTHRTALSRFEKLVVTCAKKTGEKEVSWVKYLPIEKKRHLPAGRRTYGISTNPHNVSWNNNSGAAAISIAAWAGAKRIILVGFDMTLKDNEQHFHNEYIPVGQRSRFRKGVPFAGHLRPWGVIKGDADNMGIEILNTSLNSEIKEIQKVHIKELL